MKNPAKQVHDVAIVGAGIGGVGFGVKLLQAGRRDFIVLERGSRPGGVWRDNIYPGCSCDVPAHLYWYPFAGQPGWSALYPSQAELLHEIETLIDKTALRRRIALEACVDALDWDEDQCAWTVRLTDGRRLKARTVVTACGQLGRPAFGRIVGRERFRGPSFHSAEWRNDVDLSGRRIALIGSGASAAQIAPEIAGLAGRLTLIQRTPAYVAPRGDHTYTADERRHFAGNGDLLAAMRQEFERQIDSDFHMFIPGADENRQAVSYCRQYLDEIVEDRALRERLWPAYGFGCKRTVFSDNYFEIFNRPNVELVRSEATEIFPHSVGTRDGGRHPCDVVIYATGFEAANFLPGISVTGRGGISLKKDAWRERISAFLGLSVPGFPNFFMLYGPNTHSHGAITSMLEAQFEHVLAALRMRDRAGALELRPESHAAFARDISDRLAGSVLESGCGSWHLDDAGKVVTNWWGTVEEYRRRTSRFDPADYCWLPAAGAPAPRTTRGSIPVH